MPFAVTCMDLETVTPSEVSQPEKEKYWMTSLYMWNLKQNDTNELTYRTERDSQNLKHELMAAGEKRQGVWEGDVHTAIFKMIPKKDLLYSTWNSTELCASLGGKGVWGRMGTCTCVAESLKASPETVTTLLITYTSIQNKKFKVWKKK